MADDMEKKGQQGSQSGQGNQGGQSGQHGQGQQSGQSGQNQPKKGGQGQNENEEDDQNRDRQRRASYFSSNAIAMIAGVPAFWGRDFVFIEVS